MDILVLDKEFKSVAILDVYSSLIWTERYWKPGDFELQLPLTKAYYDIVKTDYYLTLPNYPTDTVMIVEGVEVKTDVEEGDKIVIRGRSLESILNRRILYVAIEQDSSSGGLVNVFDQIIDQNFTNPADSLRDIDLIWVNPTDLDILSYAYRGNWYGENALDVICDLCEHYQIGIKVTFGSSNDFEFTVYAGIDRSYAQSSVPYVVFSKNFENLLNGDYIKDTLIYKTISLTVGDVNDGTYGPVESFIPGGGSLTGLDRRELFTDESSFSHFYPGTTTPIGVVQYSEALRRKGRKNLREHPLIQEFDGKAETNVGFLYGVDYFLGDIVQVVDDEYGGREPCRITEMTLSQGEDGLILFPTFDNV